MLNATGLERNLIHQHVSKLLQGNSGFKSIQYSDFHEAFLELTKTSLTFAMGFPTTQCQEKDTSCPNSTLIPRSPSPS